MKYICNCKNESEIRFSTFQNGSRCGKCKNKTEEIVYSFFKNKYIITHQAKFDWCKNINHLPFDFLFNDYKILLEIDGRQHFEQVSNWESPDNIFKKDIMKMKSALENNYSIIRIFQEDIFYNNINWQDKIINSIKYYDDPSIIYISKNLNLYDNYKIGLG
jgi:very-short-patch-repair endonuclease